MRLKELMKSQIHSKKLHIPKIMLEDVSMSSLILEEGDSLKKSKDEVQFILNLRFKSDDQYDNVHDVSSRDKTSIEDAEIINMVLPIYIEDKKVMLEEDLVKKVKLVREHVK